MSFGMEWTMRRKTGDIFYLLGGRQIRLIRKVKGHRENVYTNERRVIERRSHFVREQKKRGSREKVRD